MIITSIAQYKGTTYEVEIDGGKKLYLHIDIIADYALKKGMELDRAMLKKVVYASNFRRAYQYSLYCLDYRDYTAEEMYEKLLKTYKNEELCLAVIRKLAAAGLINDRRCGEKLARRYVEGKLYGYHRAKRELIAKGIDRALAEELLEVYADKYEENLRELLAKKHYRNLTDSTDRRSIEKVKSALVRYGYGYDEINRAVKDYFENSDM